MNTVRTVKRVPFEKDVIIEGSIMLRAIDLSTGGLYVHTGRSFMTGQIVEVSIPFEDEYVNVKARVVRNEKAVGMGLMFIAMSYDKMWKIKKLVNEISIDANSPDETSGQTDKKRLLLVDDNITTQRIYKSKLVFEGFSVTTANDGLEALNLLQKPGADFDLILLDLYMDKLDGFEFLSELKKIPAIKKIPVIVLTAGPSTEAVKEAREKGADTILSKISTSPSSLVGTVNGILSAQRPRMAKLNCWEFRKCGKTPFDGTTDRANICPVSIEVQLDGIHGGKNAGRACWTIAGSMCDNGLQGSVFEKYNTCEKCSFYLALKEEETHNYCDTLFILNRLRE
jgi:CheY-like chemotaxis protein